MKRYGHDSVGGKECLFYAVAVVYVDINVQYSVVVSIFTGAHIQLVSDAIGGYTDRSSSKIPRTISKKVLRQKERCSRQ